MRDHLQEGGQEGYWIAQINDLIEKCMSHLKLMGFTSAAHTQKSWESYILILHLLSKLLRCSITSPILLFLSFPASQLLITGYF